MILKKASFQTDYFSEKKLSRKYSKGGKKSFKGRRVGQPHYRTDEWEYLNIDNGWNRYDLVIVKEGLLKYRCWKWGGDKKYLSTSNTLKSQWLKTKTINLRKWTHPYNSKYLLFPIHTKKRGKYLLNSSYLLVEHRICKCIQTFIHILCRIKGYVIHTNRYFYASPIWSFIICMVTQGKKRGDKIRSAGVKA